MTEQNHNPYSWYDNIVKGAERERQERINESKEAWKAVIDKAVSKREQTADLMAKTAKAIHEGNITKRDKEVAEAKAKAIADVEAEYELKQNVKSDQTQRVDKAWKSLASDLLKNK
jgi:hypothetical protein